MSFAAAHDVLGNLDPGLPGPAPAAAAPPLPGPAAASASAAPAARFAAAS